MTTFSNAPSHSDYHVPEPVRSVDDLPHVTMPQDYAQQPGRFLARCFERYGPIFASDWPQYKVVYMVGPEANRFVLHTHRDAFSHDLGWSPVIGTVLGKGLLNMDGEEHAQHRRLMNPAFAAAYMDHYLPIMTRVIEKRTSDWAARGEVDLYEEARKVTFDIAAEALVGFSTGPRVDHVRKLFARLMKANPNAITPQMLIDAFEVKALLMPLLKHRIRSRRSAPTDDLLGLLVGMRDEKGKPLSDAQILGHLNILLVAGHETLTSLSAWLLYSLACHPRYLERVREEIRDEGLSRPYTADKLKAMKTLGYALKEAERLYPPISNLPRGVVKPFTFKGYTVEPGQHVLLSISGSHALSEVWQNPEAFDPDRFAHPREEEKKRPYSLIGFGGGPRICIGQNFATMEIKALAASVLSNFDLEVVEAQEIIQEYKGPGSPKNGIRVRVKRRDNRT
jgi:cytochrome P450